MQSIGADHQVEPAPSASLKPNIHARFGFLHADDAVIEDVLGGRAGSLVENSCQIAAQDLELAASESIGHARDLLVIPIHDRDRADAGLHPLHFRQQPHAFEHANGSTAKIDRVAARTQRRRTLHNRWLKPILAKPERQCRTGYARS